MNQYSTEGAAQFDQAMEEIEEIARLMFVFTQQAEEFHQAMKELDELARDEMRDEEKESATAGEERDISLTSSDQTGGFPFRRFSMRWHTAAGGT